MLKRQRSTLIATLERRQRRSTPIATLKRHRWRSTPIATLERRRWRRSRRFSSPLAPTVTLQLAVGADGDASARRWRRSRRLSVAVGADGDASARRWQRFNSPLATLQLAVGADLSSKLLPKWSVTSTRLLHHLQHLHLFFFLAFL